MTTFLHSGNAGDVIMSLPTIRAMGGGVLYLHIDQPGYYSGPHPLGRVMLNREYAEQLIPLLRTCLYISDAKIWEDEPIDVDLNEFRRAGNHLDRGHIGRWSCMTRLVAPNTETPWLDVTPATGAENTIIINRTSRYWNPNVCFCFLREYKHVRFLGTDTEHDQFDHRFHLDTGQVICQNFLEIAQVIAGCKAFIGSQSVAACIAEGMKKKPRAVIMCPACPNLVQSGKDAYDLWTQQELEDYIEMVSTKGNDDLQNG